MKFPFFLFVCPHFPLKIEESYGPKLYAHFGGPMNTKLFVGLTFYPDNSFAKNIESFRSRFDEKYQNTPYLHLPIVPPFEIEVQEVKKLQQELVEELESFYFENTANHSMQFTGLDVHEYKKSILLYLNPVIEDELAFCQESLFSICQSYITDRTKKMKDKKTFLTIGAFKKSMIFILPLNLPERSLKSSHLFLLPPFAYFPRTMAFGIGKPIS